VKIGDLKAGMRDIVIKGKVVGKLPVKNVNTINGPAKVAKVIIEDESGIILLNLWNEDIEKVHIGDYLSIKKAYVIKYRGQLQLNVSRRGKIEIL